jgi:H+-transporting ATPase
MAIEGSRRIYQRMKTFLLAMNTRKIALPLLLSLGVVLLDSFVLSPLLMVLLMLSADIVTMSVSMDQVTPSPGPDRWEIRPLMVTALSLGTWLLLMSGLVFWVGTRVLGFGMAQIQTLVFVWLVFAASQAVVYLSRSRGRLWAKPYPARPVVMGTVLNVGAFALMATMGWLMAPISLPLIGGVLGLALVFLFSADGLKALLARGRPMTPTAVAAPAN